MLEGSSSSKNSEQPPATTSVLQRTNLYNFFIVNFILSNHLIETIITQHSSRTYKPLVWDNQKTFVPVQTDLCRWIPQDRFH
jgi:hypothetical protein